MSEIGLDLLPEDCFAQIMSLTSPQDVCRSVVFVSSLARFKVDSDAVWQKFLPSDCEEILSRLVSPFDYSSQKELFARLSKPQLIDGGRKIFSIEKSSGKKCYMLSARELSITWASHPLYWSWKPLPQSRFVEVAELRTISWLEIQGMLNTRLLSPGTIYGAYLIVNFAGRAYGLDFLPSEVSLEVGNFRSRGNVYLARPEAKKQDPLGLGCLSSASRRRSKVSEERHELVPVERKDGWIEIELGHFFNDHQGDEEVKMCLKEVKGEHLKGGLLVEGIELRPKD